MLNPGDMAKASEASGSIANTILDKASQRLSNTKAEMDVTLKAYNQSVTTYTEIATKQADIAAELAKLAREEVTLVSIWRFPLLAVRVR
jgi:hypothetical protein